MDSGKTYTDVLYKLFSSEAEFLEARFTHSRCIE